MVFRLLCVFVHCTKSMLVYLWSISLSLLIKKYVRCLWSKRLLKITHFRIANWLIKTFRSIITQWDYVWCCVALLYLNTPLLVLSLCHTHIKTQNFSLSSVDSYSIAAERDPYLWSKIKMSSIKSSNKTTTITATETFVLNRNKTKQKT